MSRLLSICLIVVLAGCKSNPIIQEEVVVSQFEYEKAIEAMCADAQCMDNINVKLLQDDGVVYDMTLEKFAVVQADNLFIAAGQSLLVEAEVTENKLVGLKVVETVQFPERTLFASFTQMDKGGMMLELKNPFEKLLKFNMLIMPLDKEDLYETSSCPVIAKGGSFEMWPYPIFQVVLSNATLLESADTMSCVF